MSVISASTALRSSLSSRGLSVSIQVRTPSAMPFFHFSSSALKPVVLAVCR